MSPPSPRLSVISPTRHEEAGITDWLRELSEKLSQVGPAEIIVVDDSDNNLTVLAAREAAKQLAHLPVTIRTIYRKPEERTGGLSGAVVHGIREAQASYVVVIDGDGQHHPQSVPDLLAKIEDGHDIVSGTRYADGGTNEGLAGPHRRFVSRASNFAAKAIFPRRLAKVTDPMSGCFAVRKHRLNLDRMRVDGFKILLSILAHHPHLSYDEVGITFRKREAGVAEAKTGNGIAFLKQLPMLRLLTLPKIVKFVIGGGAIAALGALLLWALVSLGVNPTAANAIQLVLTLVANFGYSYKAIWSGQDRAELKRQISWFALTRGFTQILSWVMFVDLVGVGWHYQPANAVGLILAGWLNYRSSQWVVFGRHAEPASKVMILARLAWQGLFLAGLIVGLAWCWHVNQSLLIVTVMLVVANYNLIIGGLEVRWRLYAWRTPEAAKRISWPPAIEASASVTRFSLIVPALREADSIGDTLRRLLMQTHPLVEIIVSLCDNDLETITAVQAVIDQEDAHHRIRTVTAHYEKPSKPQQLNTALPECTGNYVGIVDAESMVAPDLLLHAEALIDQTNADVVQGGVQLMNPGSSLKQWFQVHNVLEYFFWFTSRMAFQSEAQFVPLGGNTVFVRRELLVAVKGWPLSLTEDCALGVLLCALHKVKVVTAYDAKLATQEESPPTIFNKEKGSLFFQRVRWVQGFLDEFLKVKWLKMPTLRQKFLAGYILATPFLQAVSAALLPVALVTALAMKQPILVTLWLFTPFVPISLLVVTQLIGLRVFSKTFGQPVKLRHYVSLLFLASIYQMLLGLAAAYAVRRYIKGETSWYKTGRANMHIQPATTNPVVPTTEGA